MLKSEESSHLEYVWVRLLEVLESVGLIYILIVKNIFASEVDGDARGIDYCEERVELISSEDCLFFRLWTLEKDSSLWFDGPLGVSEIWSARLDKGLYHFRFYVFTFER